MIRRPKTVGINFLKFQEKKPKENMKIKQSLPSFLVRDRFTFKLPSLNIGDIPQEDPTEILKKYKEEQLKFYANERKARETQLKQEQEAREQEAERQANEREQERIKRLEENALKLEEENKRIQEEANTKLYKKELQRKKAIEQAKEIATRSLGIEKERQRLQVEVEEDFIRRMKEEERIIKYNENAVRFNIDLDKFNSEGKAGTLLGTYKKDELMNILRDMGVEFKEKENVPTLKNKIRKVLKQ